MNILRECKHVSTKVQVEEYLKNSGIKYSILGAATFFENFDGHFLLSTTILLNTDLELGNILL